VFNYTLCIPVVIVGYQCGYWNGKGLVPRWFEGRNRLPVALIAIAATLLLKTISFPVAGFCIQAFYTPILIFAVVGIFNSFKLSWLSKGLQKVGDLSMYMWFFHAIFFTTSVNLYTKNLVFEPFHNYFYTLAMTFILTFAGSWVIKKLLSPVMQVIKRI
jgi:peptidoglycan/LPS O-acetylase OafA/YrhL